MKPATSILNNIIIRLLIPATTAMVSLLLWIGIKWYNSDVEYKTTTSATIHRLDSTQQATTYRIATQGDSIRALATCICIK